MALHRGLEFVQLIFSQSLGLETGTSARAGIFNQTLQYGQVVQSVFATGSGRPTTTFLPS